MGEHVQPPVHPPDASAGKLAIWLLGGFRVAIGARIVGEEEWRLRKAKSLIKLLALAPNHRLLAQEVMDQLWPDAEPEAAMSSFHRALYVARRGLDLARDRAPIYLHLQSEVLSLCPQEPCWIDVDAFESAAAAAQRGPDPAAFRSTLDLYAGDLLPEDRYEEWTRPRREALRQRYGALLEALARWHEAHDEYLPAIEALQRLLQHDPAHEETHRRLMVLYALTDRRQQALRQFHTLEEALRRELDTVPDPQSQRLHQDILAGRFPSPGGAPIAAISPPLAISQEAGRDTAPPALDVAVPPTSPDEPTPPNNLLLQLTSFIGRERELDEIKGLLATARLVTLTGVGGCGKTRLAVETASAMLNAHQDGIWLVELAALSDPALVPQAVASALGVPEQPGRPLTETLANYLKPRDLLLVLDNCEHLIAASAQVIETLLRTCPRLHVLATSREPLRIAGELTWRVPSLSLPDPERLPPLADLTEYEAVRLFTERAAATLPSFALTQQNAQAIAEVCYRLDGIPLAIELAAARVTMLSVEQIVARLDDCFGLLTGGSRTSLTRQQTLKATLDWSYDLLPRPERTLFERLAVFAGGFSLEAVEAIGVADGSSPAGVLDLLTPLVDKSLVVAEGQANVTRYRLLEPIRQYARDRLRESGGMASAQRSHAEWYLGLAERAGAEWWGPDQMVWLNRLDLEHDNLRAALGWCLRNDAEAGLRLAGMLWQFWLRRGNFAEGRQWLADVLAHAPPRSAMRPQVLLGACALAVRQGDFSGAIKLIEESAAVSREIGDKLECARSLHDLGGLVGVLANHARAKSLFEESLSLVREVGFAPGIASVIHSMGVIAWYEGDFGQARVHLEESVALFREAADATGLSFPLLNLGWMAIPPSALSQPEMLLWEETLMLFRQVKPRSALGYALANLGNLARLDGDFAQAQAPLEESLALFRALEDRAGLAQVYGQRGNLAASRGDFAQARVLLETCLTLRRELGDKRGIAVALANLGKLATAAGDVAAARATMAESQTLVRAMGDAPGLGGILSNLGYLATCLSEYTHAKEFFEESRSHLLEAELPREAALELFNLGTLARLQGDRLAARASFERGLALFRELGARGGAALLLDELGRLALDEGDEPRASALCQQSLALYRELGDRRRSVLLQDIVKALGNRPEPARTPRSGDQRRRPARAE